MAKDLGFSLGKLNYCLNALKDKGLIKIRNFKKIQINWLYIRTYSSGIKKTELTLNFMKRKIQEYDDLRKRDRKSKMWIVVKYKTNEINNLKNLKVLLGTEQNTSFQK